MKNNAICFGIGILIIVHTGDSIKYVPQPDIFEEPTCFYNMSTIQCNLSAAPIQAQNDIDV
jgi:hypothetical protein